MDKPPEVPAPALEEGFAQLQRAFVAEGARDDSAAVMALQTGIVRLCGITGAYLQPGGASREGVRLVAALAAEAVGTMLDGLPPDMRTELTVVMIMELLKSGTGQGDAVLRRGGHE